VGHCKIRMRKNFVAISAKVNHRMLDSISFATLGAEVGHRKMGMRKNFVAISAKVNHRKLELRSFVHQKRGSYG